MLYQCDLMIYMLQLTSRSIVFIFNFWNIALPYDILNFESTKGILILPILNAKILYFEHA